MARLEVPYPVVVDTELEIWRDYGNLGWPARYLLDPGGHAVRLPLRRGRLRGDRAGDPGAARSSSSRPMPTAAARGRPGRAARRPRPRTSRALQRARTRPARVWAVLDGHGSVTRQRPDDRPSTTRRLRADRPRAQHRAASSRSRSATASRCHAVCFTPGLAPEGARRPSRESASSRLISPGGPSSSTMTAKPGPVGARAGSAPRNAGSCTQQPVLSSRARPAAATPRVVARAAGRRGGCGRRSRTGAATPSRATTSPNAQQRRAPQLGAGQLGAQRTRGRRGSAPHTAPGTRRSARAGAACAPLLPVSASPGPGRARRAELRPRSGPPCWAIAWIHA